MTIACIWRPNCKWRIRIQAVKTATKEEVECLSFATGLGEGGDEGRVRDDVGGREGEEDAESGEKKKGVVGMKLISSSEESKRGKN
ncbi:putative nuclear export mediator factor [Sesbania bispinosa]|nr:putative nuclear export mediator factor [Sesbania bispinosa]